MDLYALREPIVQAPLAGGPSTPELAAAVSNSGGLGFVAAGYSAAVAVRDDIQALRTLTEAPFGVNVFAPPGPPPDATAVASYAATLRADAERYGVAVGEPRHDDADFGAKLELVREQRVPVVSFTFGCPPADVLSRLKTAGCDVWVTVTNPDEAAEAESAGVDALVVQGFEAGGHRGYFREEAETDDLGLLPALRLVARRVRIPLIAAGGIADGASVAAALSAGAVAAQVGSAFMLSAEAGTSEPHRDALAGDGRTRLTRAFSGRRARGIVNRFMLDHDADAPIAYPDVHHVTAPIRAAARKSGDPDGINLWAGQAHALAVAEPAGEIVRRLGREAREAAAELTRRLG